MYKMVGYMSGSKAARNSASIANRNSKIWGFCGGGLPKGIGNRKTKGIVYNGATTTLPSKWDCKKFYSSPAQSAWRMRYH